MDASPSKDGGDRVVDRHGRGRLMRRTLLLSTMTLASRVLGFVREMLAAALFGQSSAIFDAFITAWRVPNLFRRFLGEGALSTSLQTTLTEVDADEGDVAGRRLFLATVRLTSWLLLLGCVLVMAAVWLSPDQLPGTSWAWLGSDPGPVRELTVRVMPFLVFICLSALCSGALQVRGFFRAPALAPLVMNLAWIGTLVTIGVQFGWPGSETVDGGELARKSQHMDMARWLAWGVMFAGIAQLAVQVPALFRAGLLGSSRGENSSSTPPATEGGKRPSGAWVVLRTSLPLALGAAVYQINVMVDGLMAEGFLADGGPTAHYLGNRVQQFPMALIAIAAMSSVFPALKALGHRRRLGELRELHDDTQLGVAFLALPASLGLFALAHPLASVLFERGEFGPEGARRVGAVLRMLALAVFPAGAAGLLSRTYYALGDMRTPVRVSCLLLVANSLLNWVFVSPQGLSMDADGLALATTITSWGNLLLLWPGLTRKLNLPVGSRSFVSHLLVVGVAGAGSSIAAVYAHSGLSGALGLSGDAANRAWIPLLGAVGSGVLAFAALAECFRIREWRKLRERIGARLSR